MKKLLSIALCLIAVSGFAQKGKTKMAADFYGVDYSCVSVVGANEQPAEFIKAFEAINRLFLSEPKKYDVAGFTGIDILSTNVEQANEALGGLAAEQFMPRSTKADIAAQLGMTRSTVSRLIDDLIAGDVVEEGAAVGSGRGRPGIRRSGRNKRIYGFLRPDSGSAGGNQKNQSDVGQAGPSAPGARTGGGSF